MHSIKLQFSSIVIQIFLRIRPAQKIKLDKRTHTANRHLYQHLRFNRSLLEAVKAWHFVRLYSASKARKKMTLNRNHLSHWIKEYPKERWKRPQAIPNWENPKETGAWSQQKIFRSLSNLIEALPLLLIYNLLLLQTFKLKLKYNNLIQQLLLLLLVWHSQIFIKSEPSLADSIAKDVQTQTLEQGRLSLEVLIIHSSKTRYNYSTNNNSSRS